MCSRLIVNLGRRPSRGIINVNEENEKALGVENPMALRAVTLWPQNEGIVAAQVLQPIAKRIIRV